MFVFVCPIIARSKCLLFALGANTEFSPEFNFRYLRSILKVQGKMVHKDMHKIVFQSN